MNISTYEARIKALEDQLNPPGPGGEPYVISAVVTPNITLNEGGTINEKLAALMPITENQENQNYGASLTVGDTYTVRVTPGENYYVYKMGDNGPEWAGGAAGEAVDIQEEVVERFRDIAVSISVFVAPTTELGEDDVDDLFGVLIEVTAPKQ